MDKSRWVSELHWRRKGQQTRSERTQSALLDAAEELILEKGTDATSVADIAGRAGCSVGTLYHHFKDKKALYFALFHRMTDAYAALNEEAADPSHWESATIRDLLRGYMEFTLGTARENPAAKAAVSAVVADHPELGDHYAEIQKQSRSVMRDLVLARRSEITCDDAEGVVEFVIDQLAAMLRGRLDSAQQRAKISQATDDEFVENALLMVTQLLGLKTR